MLVYILVRAFAFHLRFHSALGVIMRDYFLFCLFFMGTMAIRFHAKTTFDLIDVKQSFCKWWQISVPNVKKYTCR